MPRILLVLLLGCAPRPAPPAPAPTPQPAPVEGSAGSTVRFDRPQPAARGPQAVRISADGATASADAAGAASLAKGGARLSIDVVDADLHHVLRLISDVSGLPFVVDDSVSARVTVRLVDVPWDHALAAILAAHGLTTRPLSGGGVQVRAAAP